MKPLKISRGIDAAARLLVACVFLFAQIIPSAVNAKTTAVVAPPSGRLALIIGISDYDHVPGLKNPGRDADAIAEVLENLGFEVMTAPDVNHAGFEEAIARVTERAKGKEAVLFYYAGHGFQLSGRNYLVPADARLTDRSRIPDETVALDSIIARLQDRDRQTLVLLDACRNNPIPKSAGSADLSDGLAQIETGSGTFVAFATQPGNITNDGAGQNSPFTRALVDNMLIEGISISDMMIRVRNQVEEATLQRQTPWDQSSLRSQFYFNPATEETDSLTAEDLALLEELDPVLREKFKKRFGLATLDDASAAEDGEEPQVVASIVPTLRIEQALEPEVSVNTDDAATRSAADELAAAAVSDPLLPAEETAPEMEIAAVSPRAENPRKPGLMIVAADPEPEPEPEETEVAAIPEAAKLPSLDDEELVRIETPLPLPRPETAGAETVEVASLEPARATAPAAPAAVQSAPGAFLPADQFPDAGKGFGTFAKAAPAIDEPEEVASLAPVPSLQGNSLRGARPGPASKPEQAAKPAPTAAETAEKLPPLVPSATLSPPPDIAVEPGGEPAATVTAELAPVPVIPEAPAAAPLLTPAPAQPQTEIASLEPPAEIAVPERPEPKEEAALPPAPPAVEPVEELSEKELAELAQKELARLGCYRSTIDGDWGPKSARALLRFYAAQKLDPDDIEPTRDLIERLEAVDTVVCKTTEPTAPVASKPAVSKPVASRPAKTTNPAPAKKQAAPAVRQKTAPAAKPKATANASTTTKKKLTGKSIMGAFR